MNPTGTFSGQNLDANTNIDVAKILEEAKIRRATEAERRAIIRNFRQEAEPNLGKAIIYFCMALFQGATAALVYSVPRTAQHTGWSFGMMVSVGFALYWCILGVRKIRVTPRDRYLLLVADEMERRNAD